MFKMVEGCLLLLAFAFGATVASILTKGPEVDLNTIMEAKDMLEDLEEELKELIIKWETDKYHTGDDRADQAKEDAFLVAAEQLKRVLGWE